MPTGQELLRGLTGDPMEQATVYVTRGGQCWHAAPDCEALSRGQTEAELRGATVHPVEAVPLGDLLPTRRPCTGCVPADPVLSALASSAPPPGIETVWELRFYDEVLRGNPLLDGWRVEPQREEAGYRIDFALLRGSKRIAIEIDGEAKGTDHASRHDETRRRQNVLTETGWSILRFSNRQVANSIDYCREQLARTIRQPGDETRDVRQAAPMPAQVPEPAANAPELAEGRHAAPSSAVRQDRTSSTGWWVAAAVLVVGGVAGVASAAGGSSATSDGVAPQSSECPSGYPIKGNAESMIFHVPGDKYYESTWPVLSVTQPDGVWGCWRRSG